MKTMFNSPNSFRTTILIIFFCQLIYSNCTADTKQNHRQQEPVIDENFDEFYKKFYKDSLFQVSRVVFPLKGFNSDEYDPELGDKNPPYFWKKKDWIFLHTLDQDKLKDIHEDGVDVYRKTIKHNSSLMVTEKMYMEESGYSEERRFKKNNGKWYLVFYSFKDL
jgi:hypothetical protein